MSFLDYQRLDDILNHLIIQKFPVNLEELHKLTQVSTRTLRNDIKTINDYIVPNGAEVKLKRGAGYLLEYKDKTRFEQFWSSHVSGTFLFTSADARLKYLLRVFLTSDDYITHEHLLNTLYISPNTLYNDFKSLKEQLEKFQLQIINKSNIGYTLIGHEQNIRLAINHLIFQDNLSDFIAGINSVEKDICLNIDNQRFNDIFWSSFKDIIHLESDYFHRNLYACLLLSVSRIKQNKLITDFSKEISITPSAHECLTQFWASIESGFDLSIIESEKNYSEYVLSENFPYLIEGLNDTDNERLAEEMVRTIITHLAETTKASWSKDRTLFNNLIDHVRRLLRIQFIEGNRQNPILEAVKNNFPYPFELAISSVQIIEKRFNISFSEDEISFIALYLASAIERAKESEEGLSLAIICGTGQTLSSIIESKIKQRFSQLFTSIDKMSFLVFEQTSKTYDLIISTIPLINQNRDNIIYLDINHIESTFKQIEEIIPSLKPNSKRIELFQENHFWLINKKISRDELLEKLAEELMAQHYVDSSFFDDLIKRENLSSTAINGHIALPHPIGHSVLKSTVFTVVIPKGIQWGEAKKVKFVFLMAIKPEDTENAQYIYDYILDFISSEKKQELLLKQATFKQLTTLFEFRE